MVDRITQVLEDGTIYSFDLDKCLDEAGEVLDKLYEKEGVELDFDYTATVYSLFVRSIYILTNSGWTTRDLLNEVIEHSDANDAPDFD